MTPEERKFLVDFCVNATADIHGLLPIEIDREPFEALSDEVLLKEADWLDELLGK